MPGAAVPGGKSFIVRVPDTTRVLRGELVRSAKDETKMPLKRKGGSEGKPGRNVGDALRQAYDDAVSEAVPDDLLDLLKKLD
jgi:hypothetical protein